MAAESEFSWLKLASFIGALLLVVMAFVDFSIGISLIEEGTMFNGVAVVMGGVVSIATAVIVYKHYQKWSLERRSNNSKH